MAGLFGGPMFGATNRTPILQFQQYLASINKWSDVTKKMKVDVELLNHPIMDELFIKLAKLRARRQGEPHPLVVGAGEFQRFVNVMAECVQAQMGRRER